MTFTANVTMEQAAEIILASWKEIVKTKEQAIELLNTGKYDIVTEDYYEQHDCCYDEEYFEMFPERRSIDCPVLFDDLLGLEYEGRMYEAVKIK